MPKKVFIIILIFLCVLLVGAGGLSYWLYYEYVSPEEIAATQRAEQLEAELNTATDQIADYRTQIAALNEEAAQLNADLEEKRANIEALKQKISVLLDNSEASDEYQAVLLEQIRQLEDEMAIQESRILELDELISQYENITTLNFGYQAKKISDLLIKLAEPNRPLRTITTESASVRSITRCSAFSRTRSKRRKTP